MKKVLVLVLSCETKPYGKMVDTSKKSWDSISVEGCETLYYFGLAPNPRQDKDCVYLPVKESLENMGEKTIQGLEYALKNYEFDYIARVNSCCYVSKQKLVNYVQGLPYSNVFEGLEVADTPKWMVGAGQFLYSKDVAQKIVDNKLKWNHSVMEDVAISYLANDLGIEYRKGNACSINKQEDGRWLLISYGFGQSIVFDDFKEVADSPHYFWRVKQDLKRDIDEYIMNELFKYNT